MSFRSQLWSLERATPTYGADSYLSYGDEVGDLGADVESGGARVHAFESAWHTHDDPSIVLAAPVAAAPRRSQPYRRRRQVLSLLVLATAAAVAPAVLLAGPWLVVEAVVATLLAAYLGLLIRRGRREAERAQKVRYLTPIRAPRPAVVVIGSGAVR
jgi:hypothetical protein